MIREEKFVFSHRPYAVDLSGLRMTLDRGIGWTDLRIGAVWYRRKNGITSANIGTLWDHQKPAPADAEEFLARHDDGRYGGQCDGRWDGESYWGNVPLTVQEIHLAVLRPMLAAYPEIPPGYSGWWRF